MRLEVINTRSQNRDETILESWLQPKGWSKATLCCDPNFKDQNLCLRILFCGGH